MRWRTIELRSAEIARLRDVQRLSAELGVVEAERHRAGRAADLEENQAELANLDAGWRAALSSAGPHDITVRAWSAGLVAQVEEVERARMKLNEARESCERREAEGRIAIARHRLAADQADRACRRANAEVEERRARDAAELHCIKINYAGSR